MNLVENQIDRMLLVVKIASGICIGGFKSVTDFGHGLRMGVLKAVQENRICDFRSWLDLCSRISRADLRLGRVFARR